MALPTHPCWITVTSKCPVPAGTSVSENSPGCCHLRRFLQNLTALCGPGDTGTLKLLQRGQSLTCTPAGH